MKIYDSVIDLVGRTPLLRLNNYCFRYGLSGNILAKLEYFNPAGSVKDRVAKKMILDAEDEGLLVKGSTIIEPTSGNTGIGLASIGGARGYKVVLTMPETMSVERRELLKAYGAEVVLTPGALGMKGAIARAKELLTQIPNSYMPSQFDNPSNSQAHYISTGVEIYEDTEGLVDILVAGVGTGGTITGVGKYLKEKNPKIKIIAVEPKDSPILSMGISGAHKIQGIGAGFVPKVLNTSIYDDIITIDHKDAYKASQDLAKYEGILVGISSGAALKAATIIAMESANIDKNIVVILPDTGERYLSSDLFKEI